MASSLKIFSVIGSLFAIVAVGSTPVLAQLQDRSSLMVPDAVSPDRQQRESAILDAARSPLNWAEIVSGQLATKNPLPPEELIKSVNQGAIERAVSQYLPANPGKEREIRSIASAMIRCLDQSPPIAWRRVVQEQLGDLDDGQLVAVRAFVDGEDYHRMSALLAKAMRLEELSVEEERMRVGFIAAESTNPGVALTIAAMYAFPTEMQARIKKCHEAFNRDLSATGIVIGK